MTGQPRTWDDAIGEVLRVEVSVQRLRDLLDNLRCAGATPADTVAVLDGEVCAQWQTEDHVLVEVSAAPGEDLLWTIHNMSEGRQIRHWRATAEDPQPPKEIMP